MRPSKKTGRYLAVALLVPAVAACAYAWHERANSPHRLLADAYTEQRTLELRIPGAAHAPRARAKTAVQLKPREYSYCPPRL